MEEENKLRKELEKSLGKERAKRIFPKLANILDKEQAELLGISSESEVVPASEEVVEQWQKQKDVSGFDYVKQQEEKKAELEKEYEETKTEIQNKFKKYLRESLEKSEVNLEECLNLVEEKLKTEGLVRNQLSVEVKVKFGQNPSIKIKTIYATFFNASVIPVEVLETRANRIEIFDPVESFAEINLISKELMS